MSKIFATYPLPGPSFQELKELYELTVHPGPYPISREKLLEGVKEAEILICLLTEKIDREILEGAPNLKVIANYAVGYDNIDLTWATVYDIAVLNTPDVLTDATADLTFSLLLAAARNLNRGEQLIRSGKWNGWRPDLLLGTEVSGKTLGIIGMGRIGRAVARRAKGFSMKILYYSRSQLPPGLERDLGIEFIPLEELLQRSDFVSLHCPLTPETHHLLDREKLALMKRDAILINTARGAIVEEEALLESLKSGKLAAAALDVFENEPSINPKLLELPNLVLTPHLGSATVEARERMTEVLVRGIQALLRGEKPHNIVNPEVLPKQHYPQE